MKIRSYGKISTQITISRAMRPIIGLACAVLMVLLESMSIADEFDWTSIQSEGGSAWNFKIEGAGLSDLQDMPLSASDLTNRINYLRADRAVPEILMPYTDYYSALMANAKLSLQSYDPYAPDNRGINLGLYPLWGSYADYEVGNYFSLRTPYQSYEDFDYTVIVNRLSNPSRRRDLWRSVFMSTFIQAEIYNDVMRGSVSLADQYEQYLWESTSKILDSDASAEVKAVANAMLGDQNFVIVGTANGSNNAADFLAALVHTNDVDKNFYVSTFKFVAYSLKSFAAINSNVQHDTFRDLILLSLQMDLGKARKEALSRWMYSGNPGYNDSEILAGFVEACAEFDVVYQEHQLGLEASLAQNPYLLAENRLAAASFIESVVLSGLAANPSYAHAAHVAGAWAFGFTFVTTLCLELADDYDLSGKASLAATLEEYLVNYLHGLDSVGTIEEVEFVFALREIVHFCGYYFNATLSQVYDDEWYEAQFWANVLNDLLGSGWTTAQLQQSLSSEIARNAAKYAEVMPPAYASNPIMGNLLGDLLAFGQLQNSGTFVPGYTTPQTSGTEQTYVLYVEDNTGSPVGDLEVVLILENAFGSTVATVDCASDLGGNYNAVLLSPSSEGSYKLYWRLYRGGSYIGDSPEFEVIVLPDGYSEAPPSIQVTIPDGQDGVAYSDAGICWDASDPDNNAIIQLYWDSNNYGYDGTLIAGNIFEDEATCYTWDVLTVPDGDYWIYAIISDGTSEDRSYSPAPVTVVSAISGESFYDRSVIIETSDGDAFAESGETIVMTVELRNRMDFALYDVEAILVTQNTSITIDDNRSFRNAVEARGIFSVGFNWRVPSGYVGEVDFDIQFTYDDPSGQPYFESESIPSQTVFAPGTVDAEFTVGLAQTRVYDDGEDSNNDGIIQSGEERIRYELYVTNTGNGDAFDVDVEVLDTAPLGVVLKDRTVRYPNLAAGSSSYQSPDDTLSISFAKNFAGNAALELLFRYNGNQETVVPVVLDVAPAPWARIDPLNYNLGQATPGLADTTVTVRNLGTGDLHITSFEIGTAELAVSPVAPVTVPGGQSVDLQLTVDGSALDGAWFGDVVLNHDSHMSTQSTVSVSAVFVNNIGGYGELNLAQMISNDVGVLVVDDQISTLRTGNFDLDPELEIAIATLGRTNSGVLYPGALMVWDHNGTTWERVYIDSTPGRTGQFKNLVVGDLDGDGRDEIVVAGLPFEDYGRPNSGIYVYDFTGEQYTLATTIRSNSYWKDGLGIGDIDNDGHKEIVFFEKDGDFSSAYARIHEYEQTTGLSFSLRWSSGVIYEYYVTDEPVDNVAGLQIGDSDGDGVSELLFMTDSGQLFVYENRNIILRIHPDMPAFDGDQWDADHYSDLAVGDVDGDGRPEIIFTTEDSDRLYVVESTGNNAYDLISPFVYEGLVSRSEIVLDDYNGNGLNDIIVLGNNSGDGTYLNVFENFANNSYAHVYENPSGLITNEIQTAEVVDILNAGDGVRELILGWEDDSIPIYRMNAVGGSDLVIFDSNVTIEGELFVGGDAQIRFSAVNAGATDMSNVVFRAYARPVSDASASVVGEVAIPFIGAGQAVVDSIAWTPSAVDSVETSVEADPDGAIAESDESNNVGKIIVVIAPNPNSPPSDITILSPSDDQVFLVGQAVTLFGSAFDPDDGELVGNALRWTSSIDGELGFGGSLIVEDFSIGDHLVSLSACDAEGACIADTVAIEVRATAEINFALSSFGTTASDNGHFAGNTVAGNAIDGDPTTYWAGLQSAVPQTLEIALPHEVAFNRIRIIENLATAYFTYAEFEYYRNGSWQPWLQWTKATPGMDVVSDQAASARIRMRIHASTSPSSWNNKVALIHELEVYGPNNIPYLVTISSPDSNAVFFASETIEFAGDAIDVEDGPLGDAGLHWSSSLDGALGEGRVLYYSALSMGQHLITLEATDSGGSTATASVPVEVVAVTGGNVALTNLGATATDNGHFSSSTDASKAIDGIPATSWDGLQSAAPQVITVTLPDTSRIFKVIVQENNPSSYFTSAVFEYFDGAAWVELFTHEKAGPGMTRTVPLVAIDQLRMSVTECVAPASWYNKVAQIHGIEIFATNCNEFGSPPDVVRIDLPVDGSSYGEGQAVFFLGYAHDPDEGDLSGGSLAWVSDLDGPVGVGAAFSISTLAPGGHQIRLTASDNTGRTGTAAVNINITAVSSVPGEEATPKVYALNQCYPNPFNPMTTISFDMPKAGRANLRIYDLRGRLVRNLSPGQALSAGRHAVVWQGRDDEGRSVATGVYFYRLVVGDFVATRRMTLIK